MTTWWAHRLEELPPYLFVEIDRRKREAIAAGRDVIDFGVGDPDQPTPGFIVDRMADAIRRPGNHHYALGVGGIEFRNAVADFFVRRFGVKLDPKTEVVALLGSKEGIGHLPTAVVNPGETVLIPDPGYPVYTAGTIFAGGKCHTMSLRESNGWLPVLGDVSAEVRRTAKLMFLNYPNNPTAACAPLSFFEEAVAFAREHHILIAQDAAYSEVYFDPDHSPPSILQVEGAKDVAVEFHSLSKTFNMTGWRVGFAVGNADALAALAKVKNNLDSGIFGAVQEAGVEALTGIRRAEVIAHIGPDGTYRRRRDVLIAGLRESGWSVASPQATFYVWAKCPGGLDSLTVASRVLDDANVVLIPGIGFGRCGEGYVRIALTVDESRTAKAVERIARLKW
jgi:LL-diaminopimelate aminotransferase